MKHSEIILPLQYDYSRLTLHYASFLTRFFSIHDSFRQHHRLLADNGVSIATRYSLFSFPYPMKPSLYQHITFPARMA